MTLHRPQIGIISECFIINLFYRFIDDGIHNVLRRYTARVDKNIISGCVIGHFASI
jgi:hypothetical protein